MLKEFENWLLEQNYKPTTALDYHGRIVRLCRKEEFTLAHLVENYIYYYNNERYQWNLNKMTSAERRCHLLTAS